jgi:hypothetical protein
VNVPTLREIQESHVQGMSLEVRQAFVHGIIRTHYLEANSMFAFMELDKQTTKVSCAVHRIGYKRARAYLLHFKTFKSSYSVDVGTMNWTGTQRLSWKRGRLEPREISQLLSLGLSCEEKGYLPRDFFRDPKEIMRLLGEEVDSDDDNDSDYNINIVAI